MALSENQKGVDRMNRRKIADRIVIIFCIIFLTGRSIYLEYNYYLETLNYPVFLGLSASCGLNILIYIIGIWIKERRMDDDK